MTEERKPYPENDPVTRFLRDKGFEINAYYMGSTSLLLGGRVEYDGCEIIYRVVEDVVIPVIYRRIEPAPKGLKNQSRPLLWFIETVAYDIPEIRYVRGNLDPVPTPDNDGLCIKKMYRFCFELLGAEHDPELGWYRIDLSKYQPLKARHREKARQRKESN
ncbi:MAG: hypothetical protein ACPG5T_08610 [Endozoicomonas sp.]